MPPTRGHDLKPYVAFYDCVNKLDAPHTGARLETVVASNIYFADRMPPTRGHDLKRDLRA